MATARSTDTYERFRSVPLPVVRRLTTFGASPRPAVLPLVAEPVVRRPTEPGRAMEENLSTKGLRLGGTKMNLSDRRPSGELAVLGLDLLTLRIKDVGRDQRHVASEDEGHFEHEVAVGVARQALVELTLRL